VKGTNLNMAATQTPRFTRESEAAPAQAPARSASADHGVGPGPSPSIGLLIGRLIVGFVMAYHGYQKLFDMGPATFGRTTLDPLGVPMPVAAGYLVTFTELIGGLLLMAGLLTRLAAVALTIDLVLAIVLVKSKLPFIVPPDKPGTGAELDVSLIAGFVIALFAGPGRFSLDRILGVDGRWARPLRTARRAA
jgi:putative oxidoreductase